MSITLQKPIQTAVGNIPHNWEAKRAKFLFRERQEKSTSGQQELLSASHKTGITKRAEKNVSMFLAESTEGYKIVVEGDVVINTMWGWMGAMGVSEHDGIISPAYGVYEPTSTRLHPKYFDYVLRSLPFIAEVNRQSKGVWSSRLRLYPAEFLNMMLPLPPIEEQVKIASFLDERTSHIANLINRKMKSIGLLREKWSSIIDCEIKNDNTSFKRFGNVAERQWRSIDRISDQEYVPLGLYNRGRGIFMKEPTLGRDLGDSTFGQVELDDIIFSGQFAWEGSVAIVGPDEAGCVVSHRYPIYRGREGLNNSYLLAFFRTREGLFLMRENSRGAAGRNRPLNPRNLEKESIPIVKPRVQAEIAQLVDLERSLATSLKKYSQTQKEYSDALIASAVIGRLETAVAIKTEVAADNIITRIVASEIITAHANSRKFGRVKFQKILYLAEAHCGVHEFNGQYTREAAGPLDRQLLNRIEADLTDAGWFSIEQAEDGGAVTYAASTSRSRTQASLSEMLGDRGKAVTAMISKMRDMETISVEAVTTLYAVWNDFLIDGDTPTDEAIAQGVLKDWHPEKKDKFRADELHTWIGWMRRNDLVPTGTGPRTTTGRLFV